MNETQFALHAQTVAAWLLSLNAKVTTFTDATGYDVKIGEQTFRVMFEDMQFTVYLFNAKMWLTGSVTLTGSLATIDMIAAVRDQLVKAAQLAEPTTMFEQGRALALGNL